MIKVSVVIPVYNMETYIEECLDSIFSQTLKEIEVLCIDDGSTDQSLNICNSFAEKDSRIRVAHQENKGLSNARNKGMELAKQIEQLFKDRCAEFKEQYKLNFGVYYTPAENLCFTAMKKFQEKYGVIANVSDKKFFTNSIHVPVWIKMTPTEKIDIESQLTGYSSAGCITYVELEGSVKNNLDALETIVNYAMDKDIPYFAVNVPNDMCINCGYCDDINKECPMCGCNEIRRLRRVTGYLTGDYKTAFNEGKQQEVEMRIKHQKF